MNEKIEIVKRMVANGYHLFGETVEHFANRFDLETLEMFEKSFKDYRKE